MLKSKFFRILLYILIPVVAILALYKIFAVADLRTDTAKKSVNEEQAKALIKEMAVAHGIENWENVKTYQVNFEDEFYGFVGEQSHPYSSNKVNFTLNYIPDSFDGQMVFENSEEIWGIQSWKTYTKTVNTEAFFKDNKDITFWLPTYQYFMEFPMRIQKANAFNYAGEKEIDGILCEGVMASWNTTEPQGDIDQYLIWLDKDSKKIVKLEYTVREMFRFLTGAAYYKDYKEYGGILLPSRFSVESNIVPTGLLHEMRVLDFKANQLELSEIRLDASLPVLGDSKE